MGEVNWLSSTQHDGLTYHKTGLESTDEDGMPMAEYGRENEKIWVRLDGNVVNHILSD